MKLHKRITINRPASDLYAYWRDIENLSHLAPAGVRVTAKSHRISHWTVGSPGGFNLEWDAEITRDEPDHAIAWRSIAGADVTHAGTVEFKPVTPNTTEVELEVEYTPPAGMLGRLAAAITHHRAESQVAAGLEQVKQQLESSTARQRARRVSGD